MKSKVMDMGQKERLLLLTEFSDDELKHELFRREELNRVQIIKGCVNKLTSKGYMVKEVVDPPFIEIREPMGKVLYTVYTISDSQLNQLLNIANTLPQLELGKK